MGLNYHLYFNSNSDIKEIFKKTISINGNIKLFPLSGNKCIHIGLQTGARYYCKNCSQTLCRQGEYHIDKEFYTVFSGYFKSVKWLNFCPSCGIDAKELVFINRFAWDVFPFELENMIKQSTDVIIKDEYDKECSLDIISDFRNKCIQIYDCINDGFS